MGFLEQLQKIMGTASTAVSAVGGPVGAAAQGVGTVASLIPKPNESKKGAANAQQNLEKIALSIDQRLKSGEIDPDTALKILEGLDAQARNLQAQGNLDYTRGGQAAAILIANVRSNAMQMKTNLAGAPIGEGGLKGTPEAQRNQFLTTLGNRFAGVSTAGPGQQMFGGRPYDDGTVKPPAEPSPLDRLLAPQPSPMDRLSTTTSAVTENFGAGPDVGGFLDRVRKRVSGPPTERPRY